MKGVSFAIQVLIVVLVILIVALVVLSIFNIGIANIAETLAQLLGLRPQAGGECPGGECKDGTVCGPTEKMLAVGHTCPLAQVCCVPI